MAGHGRETPVFGKPAPIDVVLRPFQRFMRFEAAGGLLLLAASAVALVWANSRWADWYIQIWQETKFTVGLGSFSLSKDLIHWINDLLMAIFFLLVGLEIKREMLVGELASPKKAAVPIAAAIGGMVGPALFYVAFTWGKPELRGWGVPMATDIAFALGFVALLGARAPLSLKVFLASLAIIDDLGALVVIALFYTENISGTYLLLSGLLVAGLVVLNVSGVRRGLVYMLVGVVLWYTLYKSGVHSTIAGVLVAMTVPARSRVDGREFVAHSREMLEEFERGGAAGQSIITNQRQQEAVGAVHKLAADVQTPLQSLEHRLLPWVSFLIVPIFALANAGVGFDQGAQPEGFSPTAAQWGVGFGLVLGKPIGIVLATWLAVKSGIGTLSRDITWRHVLGMGFLAGIGFTMSLFIAALAFPSAQMLAEAKVAVLGASAIAGVIGFILLWTAKPAPGAAAEAH